MSHDDPLSEGVRALLDAERQRGELPADVTARIGERLARTFALPPNGGQSGGDGDAHTANVGSSGNLGAHAATRLALGRMAPLALAFVLGGATGAAVAVSVMNSRATPAGTVHAYAPLPKPRYAPAPSEYVQRTDVAPSAVAPNMPAQPNTARIVPATLPALASNPARPPAAQARQITDGELAAERALIELARSALAQARPEDAMRAIERHARRFTQGRLAEERESLRVLSLVMVGRIAEAKQHAARFSLRYPHSLFTPVVEGALRATP